MNLSSYPIGISSSIKDANDNTQHLLCNNLFQSFFFPPHTHDLCDLNSLTRIEPTVPVVEKQSLNHRTAREVLNYAFIMWSALNEELICLKSQ